MTSFGIILCAFNAQPHLAASLAPWIAARRDHLGGHSFTICAVSTPFEAFPQVASDDTREVLRAHLAAGDIDHLIEGNVPIRETAARGAALRWLKDRGADATWMWDADEIATVEQLGKIAAFVEANPLTPWFRVAYRNHVFDERTYLVDPFTPPRIHRIRIGGYEADSFWDDNNVLYRGTITRDFRRDDSFACLTVPKTCAWIKHMSWLNDLRSKAKQKYQWDRWGNCSFKWDDAQGGLVWADPSRAPETATDP